MEELKLYNHQRLAYTYMCTEDSFALFAEQGTGKTLPTLLRIADGLKEGDFRNALVVAPKAVMGAWERDQRFFDEATRRLLREKLTIINYDMVWRDPRFRNTFDCIVLDEGHYIKNPASKRSKFLLKMSLRATHRYLLTGTPINNGKLHEYWALMAFLKPVWGRTIGSEWLGTLSAFKQKYCLLDAYYQPYAYKKVNEIQDIVQAHSYRILKKDCLDLPPKLPDELYELELQPKAIYKEMMKKSAIYSLNVLAENPLTKLLRLRQMASGYVVDGDGNRIDLPCEKETQLREFLENWDKKLVIFAEYRESIDRITKVLKEMKIPHVILDGRQKNKKIWQEFQMDNHIRVIVCQYQSASMGIDLFSADTILYYEPTISTNLLEQSRDRIHRIGTKHPCSYIHFITKGSIEPVIYERLSKFSDFTEKHFTEYMTDYQRVYRK